MERWLCVIWEQIDRQWNSESPDEGLHCGPNGSETCKYPDLWFRCPCEAGVQERKFYPRHGFVLIIAPLSLISNWKGEWQKHYDDRVSALNITLVMGHQSTSDANDVRVENVKIDAKMQEGREPFKLILSGTLLESGPSDLICSLGCLENIS